MLLPSTGSTRPHPALLAIPALAALLPACPGLGNVPTKACPSIEQAVGDCQILKCVDGAQISKPDDSDVPSNDNSCIQMSCADGQLTSSAAASGASCAMTDGADGVCNGDAGQPACVQCNESSDCAAPEVCNTATGTCLGCLKDTDCDMLPWCNTATNSCVECLSRTDCASPLVCDTTAGSCVSCNNNGACEDGERVVNCIADCGVTAVAAGGQHTCAIIADGAVRCWGINNHGQLGNGSQTGISTPVKTLGLADTKIIQLSAGGRHTCALASDKSLWCWGHNSHGQLGIGEGGGTYPIPTQVQLPHPVSTFYAFTAHTCAALLDGSVWCWGYNSHGQLGNQQFANSSLPVPVEGLTLGDSVVAVGGGTWWSCAAMASAGIWCWGQAYLAPSPVDGLDNVQFTKLSAGYEHICARGSVEGTGIIKCWGANQVGQLGIGEGGSPMPPPPVQGIGYEEVSAGLHHNCARRANREVACWGKSDLGQVGPSALLYNFSPLTIPDISGAVSVAAGDQHNCVALNDGSVWCWGDNTTGQLGNESVTAAFSAEAVRVDTL